MVGVLWMYILNLFIMLFYSVNFSYLYILIYLNKYLFIHWYIWG